MFTLRRSQQALLALCLPLSSLFSQELPFRTYSTVDGLAHNRVKRVVADSNGFLWFCTSDGVSRFDGSRFATFGTAQGAPFTSANDLLELSHGLYWIATNGDGVIRFDAGIGLAPTGPDARKARFQQMLVSRDSAANRVNVLFRDRAGTVWLGTDGGLFKTTGVKGNPKMLPVPIGIPSHADRLLQIWSIVEDQEHCLWLGTRFGLVRMMPGGRKVHYRITPRSATDLVASLLLRNDSTLWIGHQAGLLIFRPPSLAEVGLSQAPLQRDDVLMQARLAGSRPHLAGLPSRRGSAQFYQVGGRGQETW